ncbi:zinc ABC transporter substrate-binding protein [uncultured Microbacterium sp.]|uniref:metal ABC transporter solute-binding protein, Zn/Mn family n=1 Tax=uncultured Microbacterium sp. TaxID=191216 RepID=UPI0025D36906|nr:zinc ABC transporter substrate-binding protein [uncultured Microbacterium sp.]
MISRPRILFTTLATVSLGALALAGCSSSTGPAASSDGRIPVVASTNVYGQIAAAVGGDRVTVTSIISSETQDPHEFEATAADQLTVKKAGLIIENGGGYDPFLDQLVSASGATAPVITAASLSPEWPGDDDHDHSASPEATDDHADHDHVEGFNEHVFYDVATMAKLADEIAHELGDLDASGASTFEANAQTFTDGITKLQTQLDAIKTAHGGAGVFVTEPLPLYLTEAAGLANQTPEAFSEAVEEGTDVAPATLLDALGIIADKKAAVVIVNAQAAGAETTQVEDKAASAGVPVLKFSEILPANSTYLEWMQQNISQLQTALG